MKPRALVRILNLPRAERNAVLAEGMRLLAEHVAELHADAGLLDEKGRTRGRAVVDIFAAEQAASYLILLDLARVGWNNDALAREQIRRFADHLARGLYLEAYEASPADLAEIEKYLRFFRRDLFLDGPNDDDWVFRREIDDRRESSLYVDYVAYEHENAWVSPAGWRTETRERNTVIDLVTHLSNLGMNNTDALDIAADAWEGIDITDRSLHWQTVKRINAEVIGALPVTPEATDTDRRRGVALWIHPLNSLDLTPIKVTMKELREPAS
ncbi:hypothetical protein [Nocardia abscessus]|uniref:hypothetical protein n=1 Tax=Nocardia abscessus TaxID=120957 RepID=UPI002453E4DD|nr:hypothetical protein [Nocardia abscessus]